MLWKAQDSSRQEGFVDPYILEIRAILAIYANLHDIAFTAVIYDFEVTDFEVNSHLLRLAL
jgi:hypothetical protein